ncbi:MAG: hypothetical protein ABH817_01495 [archaeon]
MTEINLETLVGAVMEQAARKGFGTKPEEVIIPEKFALLHSEISDAYHALLSSKMEGRDGLYDELGDVFQRTLHLGGIYGADFSSSRTYALKEIETASREGKLVRLHKVASTAYEHYRHDRMEALKNTLSYLAHAIILISEQYGFDISDVVAKKIKFNLSRNWREQGLKETLVPE